MERLVREEGIDCSIASTGKLKLAAKLESSTSSAAQVPPLGSAPGIGCRIGFTERHAVLAEAPHLAECAGCAPPQ